ncbi:MAG TPA: K+/H+ antiporter subunit F [Burkholderiales bacterium]|jgi:multicomponent K+:H+ antiporter subunit F|nr:K+/H+ antiporter subunit F [Burkholderiales bacterium]
MLDLAISIAFAALAIAVLLNLYRLARGPQLPDRILALDTLYINVLALLVVLGIQLDSVLYFEIALTIALIGFVSTVALAKYLLHGDIIQ